MKSVVAESIKAGIPGGMFGAVMSFAAAYFLVPVPATAVANGVDNAVSGLISGFISGFLGIFFYMKASQARHANE
jgi:hypothetical protein